MSYRFASPEWAAALKEAINASATYRAAAKNWEGDFWFIVEPDDRGDAGDRSFIYVDLWHGECRACFVTSDETIQSPEFRIWGTAAKWSRVIRRDIDPIRALLTNTLKLNGNLAKVMRNVKAAQELVLCAAAVPTQF
jgi:putative sterol carrier protein